MKRSILHVQFLSYGGFTATVSICSQASQRIQYSSLESEINKGVSHANYRAVVKLTSVELSQKDNNNSTTNTMCIATVARDFTTEI